MSAFKLYAANRNTELSNYMNILLLLDKQENVNYKKKNRHLKIISYELRASVTVLPNSIKRRTITIN